MKKLILLCFIVMMCLSLCSCHGDQKTTSFVAPETLDETKTYEISFWAKNDNNIHQINVYKKAIADFEQLYPNIRVNLKLYTDYLRIYNDVITNISTNTTPNVCISYPDHIATYLTGSNVVVPLDELMENESYGFGGSSLKFDGPRKDEVIERFLNEGVIGGSQYAIPFLRSTEALYINEDYVKKLGYEIPEIMTWDFVFEVCEKSMDKDSNGNYLVNGQKIWIPFIYKSTDNMMIQMLKQKEADYSTEQGDILLFNDVSKEIMTDVFKQTEKGLFNTFKNISYPANFLNAGQALFAVDSTAGSTWMGSTAPLLDISPDAVVNFNTVSRPIPQYDVANPQMISQGPSICIFNKEDADEVVASWLFAQYLLSNDVQLGYSQTEGYLPVTSKAQESEEFKDYLDRSGEDDEHYYVKIDVQKMLMENIENTFVTPVFNGSASVRESAGQLIESAAKRAIMKKQFDEEFIQAVFDNCVSLYHLDQVSSSGGDVRKDLGPLPAESKMLLISLGAVWATMGVLYLNTLRKKKD